MAYDSEHLWIGWWLILPLLSAVFLLVAGQLAPEFYDVWIGSESRGALELSHVVLPLASLVIALRVLLLPALRQRPWLYLWVGLAALANLYIAGEEASWGQHYIGWATSESWQAINDQGETNLHNVSSWLDQKPRTLLEIGVILGGIVIPLAALRWPRLRKGWYGIVLPPMICLPSALLAEFSRMSERLLNLVADGAYLFSRASEVQELYFYYFILLYLIVLRRRLLAS